LLAIVPSKKITLDQTNGGIHRAASNDSPLSNRSAPLLRVQRFVRRFCEHELSQSDFNATSPQLVVVIDR